MYRFRNQGNKNQRAVFLRSVLQLLVILNVVPSSLTLSTLIIEKMSFSETFLLTKATWNHMVEVGILLNHRRENLKCCIALTAGPCGIDVMCFL
jgi:hypothetical protein